ncbi:MAG: nucleoside-diphosphate kinase [Herpetosiphon sp.]
MERSLVILKPDALQRALVGTLLGRLEARGLKIIGLKLMKIDEGLARKHYAELKEKKFFPKLIEYITSGPVVAVAIEGDDVIKTIRHTVGKTDPIEAAPGTIRGDYAVSVGRNLIHASDKPETGAREVDNFFSSAELLSNAERSLDRWIFETN